VDKLREQFFHTMMRFKKTEILFSTECELQMNELFILQSIACGCSHSDCISTNLDVPRIQDRLQITKPAVSYILNGLEKKNYIRREIDAKDRRKISINATPEGIKAAAESTKRLEETWNTLMERFGEEDMLTLMDLLGRLNDICESVQQDTNL